MSTPATVSCRALGPCVSLSVIFFVLCSHSLVVESPIPSKERRDVGEREWRVFAALSGVCGGRKRVLIVCGLNKPFVFGFSRISFPCGLGETARDQCPQRRGELAPGCGQIARATSRVTRLLQRANNSKSPAHSITNKEVRQTIEITT